jgi:pentatricopeptide repeat protein
VVAYHRRVRGRLVHAYAACGMVSHARRVFDRGTDNDMVAWNCLLRGYAQRGGDTDVLREFFARMPSRDSVSWNAILSWCATNGQYDEAIVVFREMLLRRECEPDRVTLVSVISAIAHLGALAQALWAHAYVLRNGIELEERLCSALLNMYSKCGFIEGAVCVFGNIAAKGSLDTYNAMVAGFTANGYSERVLELFTKMESTGLVPNKITFNSVLNACSHGGVSRGRHTVFWENVHSLWH